MRKTSIFGQNGQNGNFFKKALGKFFSRLQALTNCKVSEKSIEQFSSYRVTDVRTYGRTWILRSPTTSSRDQKVLRKFFLTYWTQTNWKFQKNIMKGFRKRVADKQTNKPAWAKFKILTNFIRRTKKLANYYEWISRKMQKTSVFRHLGPKKPIL